MRILYVEDVLPNICLIERIARMGDHQVLSYGSAEDALTHFERDNPDMVFVDIRLEGDMDGLDLTRKLRANGYQKPIIAITASITDGIEERCREAGCNAYFAKPVPVRQLWRLIQDHTEALAAKAEVKPAAPPSDLEATKPTPPTFDIEETLPSPPTRLAQIQKETAYLGTTASKPQPGKTVSGTGSKA